MYRTSILSACLLLFLACPVSAAEIYGQLRDSHGKVPAGAQVTASCGGEQITVDSYGRYRITDLPLRTNCELIISYQKLSATPVRIYTSKNRNSANITLKRAGSRLLAIRR
ncbi:Carboxypeptidase regulatory-like domain-containing protein [Malonomonas rubra DSM 5091]|uniref:Carboxypeptidase regulatory-like domain-containing protein n=1 Tax=Malonomonas rubra DSM 5091 TaxID=1122189 RepID=A0A1M6G4M8_MALRU|nr:carboxypeptidase-like regulatory domain-containing protein [Malonomonas rubra]SHJ04863.1 Carboxypeptidase regulatory-like domain-containing protein [Malonomonas rubra DSM 5091]